jgi:hypothetical protein
MKTTRQRILTLDSRSRGIQTFDAASGSGMAWLQSQLELINANPIEPLQATTHARDIPIRTGGGYPEYLSAWATNFASSGGGFYGLQGTNNTEIPEAQFDVQKGIWPTFLWQQQFTVTHLDMKRYEFAEKSGQRAPFSWQDMFNKSIDTVWIKALDWVTYNGFLNTPGLINNPAVLALVAPNPGSGTTWASKTPTQILADVNLAINTCIENSGYSTQDGCPTDMLVPYSQWATLTQPMTVSGVPVSQSTLEYIEKYNVAAANGVKFKIHQLPNDWISGKGIGGLDRSLVYRKKDDCVQLQIPQPKEKIMTVPSISTVGGGYQTLYSGCIGAVQWYRTSSSIYLDGV